MLQFEFNYLPKMYIVSHFLFEIKKTRFIHGITCINDLVDLKSQSEISDVYLKKPLRFPKYYVKAGKTTLRAVG